MRWRKSIIASVDSACCVIMWRAQQPSGRPSSCLCIIESAPEGNPLQSSGCLTGCAKPSHRPMCQQGRNPPMWLSCLCNWILVVLYSSLQWNDSEGYLCSNIVRFPASFYRIITWAELRSYRCFTPLMWTWGSPVLCTGAIESLKS